MPLLQKFRSSTDKAKSNAKASFSRLFVFRKAGSTSAATKTVEFCDPVVVSSIPNDKPLDNDTNDHGILSPSCSTLTTTLSSSSTVEFIVAEEEETARTGLWSCASSWSSTSNAAVPSAVEDKTTTLLRELKEAGRTIPTKPQSSRWEESDFLRVCHVWQLSDTEITQLRTLETELDDIEHWKNNPFEVVRFLKGPQGYKPAQRLFRTMIQWRIDNNVDAILEEYTPPQVLLDYCPSAILHGLDRDGDPIYLERAGATDASGLLRRFGHAALIRHVIWLRELCGRGAWVQEHEARTGRPITQVTIVYDLAGLNARHLRPGVLPFFCHMMKLTQDYYTGPVKRMIIIRAPTIFRVVWAVVKHCFDPWAVQKMVFTGSHNHEEIVAKYMDLVVLPPEICPTKGKGRAALGMPQRFAGGIPPACDCDDADLVVKDASASFNQADEIAQAVNVATSNLASGSFRLNNVGALEVEDAQQQ